MSNLNIIDEAGSPVNNEVGERKVNYSAGESRMELSRQWMSRPTDERFLSLDDLHAATLRRYQASQTAVINNRQVELIAPPEITSLADTHNLKAGLPDGTEADFTHWSFGQTCSLAGAPSAYLRKLPSQLVADNLTWSLSRNREVEQVKSYTTTDDTGASSLMALTGPTYGRIPDHEVVDAVRMIANEGGWKVPGVMDWSTGMYNPHVDVTTETTTLFASDRDIWLFLVDDLHPIEVGKLPNGDPDYMFRGFYVWNSEVGSKTMGVACFYLRGICCNRIMWGVENFQELSIRHSAGAPDRFMAEARPALEQFAQGNVQQLLDGVDAAKAAKVASDEEEAVEFLLKRNFSKRRTAEILETVEREEQHPARSAWDMAQGITALARTIPHTDERIDLERQAGKLLDQVAA
jgi:hypothetical protein